MQASFRGAEHEEGALLLLALELVRLDDVRVRQFLRAGRVQRRRGGQTAWKRLQPCFKLSDAPGAGENVNENC